MRHRYSGFLSVIQLILDLLALNLAFFAAIWIRFTYIAAGSLPVPVTYYVILWLVFNLLWLVLLFFTQPYSYSRQSFNLNEVILLFLKQAVFHIMLVVIFWVMVQGYYYSRGHLLMTYVLLLLTGTIWRIGAVFAIKRYRLSGFNRRNYIVAGFGELSESITSYFNMNPEMGYVFKGYFDNRRVRDGVTNWHDNISLLEEYVMDERIDYIYCCQPYLDNDDLQQIIRIGEKHRLKVLLLVDFRGFLTHEVTLEYHDYMPVINISTKAYSNVRKEAMKRIFDLIFSLTVITLGFPLFLMIGLLVKFSSKGPVLFVQERSGRWGKPFRIYKFRSMVHNSDEIAQRHSKGDDDARITPVGSFLRKTRLDELPQFFNVVKGDMSIVGPRPLARYDVEMLMQESPTKFKRVLTVRPGITSIGQVKVGYADNVEESIKRLNYDLLYVDNPSLRTDLWLIARTLILVLQRKGK